MAHSQHNAHDKNAARQSSLSTNTLVAGPNAEVPSVLQGGEHAGLGWYKKPRGPHAELLEKALYPSEYAFTIAMACSYREAEELRSIYKEHTYWADLSFNERVAFVRKQQSEESSRERSHIWSDFKEDPLRPFIKYWNTYVLAGIGMFNEGYTLFSIGRLKSLFEAAYPTCWRTYTSCNRTTTRATDYLQIVGIIIGQVAVGVESDWIGRRFGLIQDAAIMLIGAILLTGMWGANGSLQGWIACYMVAQFTYGVGVGGEYPMTATLSMERASGANADAGDRLHRGRNVTGSFLMQGWGQFLNVSILCVLLLIFNHNGHAPYSTAAASATFRVSFALIVVLLVWLLYYRIWRVKTADNVLRAAKKRGGVSGYDKESLKLTFTHYWPRLLATAVGWYCNDFAFYGASVFATEFIRILSPDSSVMTTWLWNMLATGVALIGYYTAFATIDNKFYGRRRMQLVGFAVNFILYTVAAFAWPVLTGAKSGLHGIQFIYIFSSFMQQFGPNSVTFLVAAEVYPAPIRGSAHGFSAAVGKLGALTPTVLFNYIDDRAKFEVTCWFHLIGFIVTLLFLPDTTGLDLREQERRWKYALEGRANDYRGTAVHRRHLSLWEIYVQKQHLQYDADADAKARLEEWQNTYQRERREKGEKGSTWDENASDLSSEVFEYFQQQESASQSQSDLPLLDGSTKKEAKARK